MFNGYSQIVIPDVHAPEHDRRSLAAVLQYIASHRVDRVTVLGDFWSLDCISSHNKGKLRLVENKRLAREAQTCRTLLKEITDAASVQRGAYELEPLTLDYIEGNHEDRMNRYIDEHPELEGIMEVPKLLQLEQTGWRWIPFWTKGEVLHVGKAMFIHGKYVNEHHAKRHVLAYGGNVFYGHTHDFQEYSLTTLGDDSTKVGQSLGCLCKYDQQYMQGNPSKWQQGFAHFVYDRAGHFTYWPIKIFNHRFWGPDGKEYKG